MERLDGELSVGAHGFAGVVGEGVHACDVGITGGCDGGLPAAGVDEAVGEEFAGGVDGRPELLCSWDADDGVAGVLQVGVVGVEVWVSLGAVVRDDAGGAACAEEGVMLAQDVHEVFDGECVGGVVVEDSPAALSVRLDPPDGGVVTDSDIPGCVDGEEGKDFEFHFEEASGAEGVQLEGVDVSCLDGVEGFFRCGGEFLGHPGFEGALHGEVPDALPCGDGGVAFLLDLGEVLGLSL